MPYIDNPNFVWPETVTYDVLVTTPAGEESLLTDRPEAGGLLDSANAAVEAHRNETGEDVTLVDAWVHGGRVFASKMPDPTPMRPSPTADSNSGTGDDPSEVLS